MRHLKCVKIVVQNQLVRQMKSSVDRDASKYDRSRRNREERCAISRWRYHASPKDAEFLPCVSLTISLDDHLFSENKHYLLHLHNLFYCRSRLCNGQIICRMVMVVVCTLYMTDQSCVKGVFRLPPAQHAHNLSEDHQQRQGSHQMSKRQISKPRPLIAGRRNQMSDWCACRRSTACGTDLRHGYGRVAAQDPGSMYEW